MIKNNGSKLGKWNKTQHEKFMKALQKYGKNWTLIQKAVGSRSMTQVRSHAQKLFLGMSKKEMKNFEVELKNRFECFCNLEQNKIQKKGTDNPMVVLTSGNQTEKSFDSQNQKIEGKINFKETNENEQKATDLQSEKGTKQDIRTEQSIYSQSEYQEKSNEEQQINEEVQYPSMPSLGYLELSQYGLYLIPQVPFIWMPY